MPPNNLSDSELDNLSPEELLNLLAPEERAQYIPPAEASEVPYVEPPAERSFMGSVGEGLENLVSPITEGIPYLANIPSRAETELTPEEKDSFFGPLNVVGNDISAGWEGFRNQTGAQQVADVASTALGASPIGRGAKALLPLVGPTASQLGANTYDYLTGERPNALDDVGLDLVRDATSIGGGTLVGAALNKAGSNLASPITQKERSLTLPGASSRELGVGTRLTPGEIYTATEFAEPVGEAIFLKENLTKGIAKTGSPDSRIQRFGSAIKSRAKEIATARDDILSRIDTLAGKDTGLELSNSTKTILQETGAADIAPVQVIDEIGNRVFKHRQLEAKKAAEAITKLDERIREVGGYDTSARGKANIDPSTAQRIEFSIEELEQARGEVRETLSRYAKQQLDIYRDDNTIKTILNRPVIKDYDHQHPVTNTDLGPVGILSADPTDTVDALYKRYAAIARYKGLPEKFSTLQLAGTATAPGRSLVQTDVTRKVDIPTTVGSLAQAGVSQVGIMPSPSATRMRSLLDAPGNAVDNIDRIHQIRVVGDQPLLPRDQSLLTKAGFATRMADLAVKSGQVGTVAEYLSLDDPAKEQIIPKVIADNPLEFASPDEQSYPLFSNNTFVPSPFISPKAEIPTAKSASDLLNKKDTFGPLLSKMGANQQGIQVYMSAETEQAAAQAIFDLMQHDPQIGIEKILPKKKTTAKSEVGGLILDPAERNRLVYEEVVKIRRGKDSIKAAENVNNLVIDGRVPIN